MILRFESVLVLFVVRLANMVATLIRFAIVATSRASIGSIALCAHHLVAVLLQACVIFAMNGATETLVQVLIIISTFARRTKGGNKNVQCRALAVALEVFLCSILLSLRHHVSVCAYRNCWVLDTFSSDF